MDVGFALDLEDMLLDGRTEDAERAICQAAAKITKLTEHLVELKDFQWADGSEALALRRFAELAKETGEPTK